MRELLVYAGGVATGLGVAGFFVFFAYRLAQQHNRQDE